MAEKKTIKQQANKYRNIKFGLNIAEFLAFFAPFITIALVNKDQYFVEYDGTKTSWGFILAMIVMGIGLVGLMNQKVTRDHQFLLFIIKWTTVAAAFSLLGQIIMDISMIMWYGLIGIASSYFLDIGAKAADKKYKDKLDSIRTAKKQTEIEQAKEEIK